MELVAVKCRDHYIHYTKKVKDILKFSRYFVPFRELVLILLFKSRYWQISLTFLCSVYLTFLCSVYLLLLVIAESA